MTDVVKNKNRGKEFQIPKPAHMEMNIEPIHKNPVAEPVFIVDGIPVSENTENAENENTSDQGPTLHPFIDNNDEYFPNHPNKTEIKKQTSDEYILMIGGNVIFTGNLDATQRLLKTVVYGEHEDFKDVSVEDIVVLKKMKIKIGVFVEE